MTEESFLTKIFKLKSPNYVDLCWYQVVTFDQVNAGVTLNLSLETEWTLVSSLTPALLKVLAARVRLSADLLSAMMTTAPGTWGLRPAGEVRMYCWVNVTASPTEGNRECHDSHCLTSSRNTDDVQPERTEKKRNNTDQCYCLDFHQRVWTGCLVAVCQICCGG